MNEKDLKKKRDDIRRDGLAILNTPCGDKTLEELAPLIAEGMRLVIDDEPWNK